MPHTHVWAWAGHGVGGERTDGRILVLPIKPLNHGSCFVFHKVARFDYGSFVCFNRSVDGGMSPFLSSCARSPSLVVCSIDGGVSPFLSSYAHSPSSVVDLWYKLSSSTSVLLFAKSINPNHIFSCHWFPCLGSCTHEI